MQNTFTAYNWKVIALNLQNSSHHCKPQHLTISFTNKFKRGTDLDPEIGFFIYNFFSDV